MLRSRKVQAGLGLIALAVLVPALMAMGNGQADGQQSTALSRDAASYAADFDVTQEEALRRLRIQDEVGALDQGA